MSGGVLNAMQARMSGSAQRQVLAVLLVVALATIVALTGGGLLVPRAPEASLLVRLAGGILLVGGLAALLMQRGSLRHVADRRSDPTVQALVAAGLLMTSLTVLARTTYAPPPAGSVAADSTAAASPERAPRAAAGGRRAENSIGGGGFGLGRAGPVPIGGVEGGPGESETESGRKSRLARVFLLVALAATALWALLTLRRGRDAGALPPVAALDAEAGLRSSWEEVAFGSDDPRGQITAAYRRLLDALTAADAPRAPYEAPHEHLDRTLGPLGVRPEPMRRLTRLYVQAQFSERRVTDADRAAAADALRTALDELRSHMHADPQLAVDG